MALSRYSFVVGHIKCTAASQGCRLDHSKAGTCGGRLSSLPDTALVKVPTVSGSVKHGSHYSPSL